MREPQLQLPTIDRLMLFALRSSSGGNPFLGAVELIFRSRPLHQLLDDLADGNQAASAGADLIAAVEHQFHCGLNCLASSQLTVWSDWASIH